MKKNTDIVVFLNRLLYVGILSSMVLFCFSDLHGVSGVNWKHMAVLVTLAVVFSAVSLLDGRQQMYVAVLSFLIFLFLYVSIGAERCFLYFARVLELSSVKSISAVSYDIVPEQMIYIELGRVFLLTVICYLMQLILEKNVILKILSADVVGGWLLYMRKSPKIGVVIFVLYIGLIMAEWVRARLKKMKNENVQGYILGILPFLFVYAVILYLMPMREEPYDWQWAKDIYRRAEEKITMYTENLWNSGSEYFDGADVGFSEGGGLFSGITANDRQLMTLGIGKQRGVSVYLSGKTFDSFNGREWVSRRESRGTDRTGIRNESRNDISRSERVLDAMETVYALRRYTGNLNPTFYRNIRMDVSYRYFHTNYLMAPSKTWEIEDKAKKIKYRQDGVDFVFDKKAGYGTEYTLQFSRLDMEREEVYRFLEWNQSEDVDAWRTVVRQYTGQNIPIDELYAYRERMKEQYLPKTDISPEAEEWLIFVTADAKTDTEKLKYIESALSEMRYNTNPGELPKTVTDEISFLDYFLLEKGEGYCVHFATAFVLLARAEGFPARYVQGFCIPMVRGDETSVYSDMAHAWPEVYIEGKGWIPFEPTPGFGVNRYLPEKENADGDIGSTYTREPESRMQDDVPASDSETPQESVAEGIIPEEDEQSRWLPYSVRVVWILLVGSVLAFGIDWLSERYRDKKRTLSEKYRLAVLHNLQILAILGYRRELSETFHELSERIKQVSEVSCKFIDTYEKHLYGTLEINEQILNEVLVERVQLLAWLKKYKGKTYLLCKVKLYIVRYR